MLIGTLSLVLVGYCIACLCAGAIVIHLLCARASTIKSCSAGASLASALLLGQGILANLWLLVALGGWFKPLFILGLMTLTIVGGAIFIWPNIITFLRQLKSVWSDLRNESLAWQVVALLAILICMAWFTSLGRPLMGDATAFYMALPKVVAAAHRLMPLPGYEAYTQIGLQGEMHYAALMALGGSDAAQLFAWPTIIAGTIMLLAIGSKVGLNRRGQWIVFTCVFTSSAVIYLSGDGKVDLFAAALGLAAYYWATQVGEHRRFLALALTGLFTGFAIVAKFSYIPVLLPGIVLLLVWKLFAYSKDKARFGSSLRSLGATLFQLGFWMLLAILPHLIKNYVLFDNAIAPFSTSGLGWAEQTWFRPETTRRIVLTYPFALTFGQYWGQYGNLSPLVLAFLPLAIFLPKPKSLRDSPLAAITLAALAGLICWVILRPSLLSPRYILATLLLFIPLAARAAEHISWSNPKQQWLSGSIMVGIIVTLVTVGLYFKNITFFPSKTVRYLAGGMSQCERDGVYCRAMEALNEQAEPGARVFLAAYYRYWLRPDLLQCLSGQDEQHIMAQEKTSEAKWLRIHKRGFRYLLADKTTHSKLIESLDTAQPPPWLKIIPIFEVAYLSVYRLDFLDPPSEPQVECRQVSPPAWDLVAHQ